MYPILLLCNFLKSVYEIDGKELFSRGCAGRAARERPLLVKSYFINGINAK